jgi:hypothetical protein
LIFFLFPPDSLPPPPQKKPIGAVLLTKDTNCRPPSDRGRGEGGVGWLVSSRQQSG